MSPQPGRKGEKSRKSRREGNSYRAQRKRKRTTKKELSRDDFSHYFSSISMGLWGLHTCLSPEKIQTQGFSIPGGRDFGLICAGGSGEKRSNDDKRSMEENTLTPLNFRLLRRRTTILRSPQCQNRREYRNHRPRNDNGHSNDHRQLLSVPPSDMA